MSNTKLADALRALLQIRNRPISACDPVRLEAEAALASYEAEPAEGFVTSADSLTTQLRGYAETLPPLPDVELAEIRNDSINKTRLSETGAHYWGSNWREVRKLYTAEQMRAYAVAAVAQAEAKPVPVPADLARTLK